MTTATGHVESVNDFKKPEFVSHAPPESGFRCNFPSTPDAIGHSLRLRRMIQHARKHRDGTGFCSGGLQDFRGFGARCTGGEDVIDDQDALALEREWVCNGQRIALVFEALIYRNTFLGSRPLRAFEQMNVAVDLQLSCQFTRDDPCGIEVADKSLPPMLGDRDNTVE